MSKKIKRKVIVSVVSLIIIFVLSMMISGYFEIINKWIPIIEDGYKDGTETITLSELESAKSSDIKCVGAP